jgi:hypothetical protein
VHANKPVVAAGLAIDRQCRECMDRMPIIGEDFSIRNGLCRWITNLRQRHGAGGRSTISGPGRRVGPGSLPGW